MTAGGRGRRVVAIVACAAVGVALAGCGGGGTDSTAAHAEAVRHSPLVEKIGLVPVGGGRYRLGDCIAEKVLASPVAIEGAKKDGTKLIVDPTGSLGIETDAGPRCVKVIEDALAFLNVP